MSSNSATNATVVPPSTRARGRGRGGWRGRGHGGHGGGSSSGPPTSSPPQAQRYARPAMDPQSRPTHFLCMPLGHHEQLRTRVQAFTDRLLNSEPRIAGLDPSIVILPRRLHITLGVMNLADNPRPVSNSSLTLFTSPSATALSEGISEQRHAPRTIDTALELLRSLRPSILRLIHGTTGVGIALDTMNIMQPERGDPEKANVLWFGPNEDGVKGSTVSRVGELVNRSFRQAGYITESRPLKLHCTVINTIYRKPRYPRLPFSFSHIRQLATPIGAVGSVPPTDYAHTPGVLIEDGTLEDGSDDGALAAAVPRVAEINRRKITTAVPIDMGTWSVDQIQLCEMGSHAHDGAYVSVGSISLLDLGETSR